VVTSVRPLPNAAGPLAPAAPRFATARHLAEVVKRVWRSPSGKAGLLILAVQFLVALFAPLLAPHSTTVLDPMRAFAPPSWAHPFGTDQYGRDVLSRVIFGGRTAIAVSVVASLVGVTLGAALGLVLGYVRGLVDEVVARAIDAVIAMPGLLLLLLCATIFGGGLLVLVPVLAFLWIPGAARVVRAAALDLAGRDFVAAAKARGEGAASVVARELAPNALDVVLVELAMRASWTALAIAGLSFLGFGVNPPTPDWGLMVAENRSMMQLAPWGTLFPVLALATLVIGYNLVADALAKALGLDRTHEVPQ